jgi:hypothetical protein
MHKQVSSLLANGSSPGRLAEYTALLAQRGENIRAIGGSEWNHHAAVAVLLDDRPGRDEGDLAEWLSDRKFPTVKIFTAEAILSDVSGSLATAAALIAKEGLNILTVLVADTHLEVGLVSFGFATEDEARRARVALGDDLAVPPHTLTHAWQDHEAWDQGNPDKPDPRNPSGG